MHYMYLFLRQIAEDTPQTRTIRRAQSWDETGCRWKKAGDEGAIGGNLSHASDIALWRERDVCLVG